MAEEVAKGAAAPQGIQLVKLITLPVCGKTVEIKRWSYQRGLQVAQFMYELTDGLPDDQVGDMKAMMRYFFEKGGAAYLEVAKLSLSPEYRGVVDAEIDAVDAEVLIEAAFAFNDSQRTIKNAVGSASQFAMGKVAQRAAQMEPQKAN